MYSQFIHRFLIRLTGIVALLVASGGCTLDKQAPGTFFGPSELAISTSITATPPVLPRDGSSQSVVTIRAVDERQNPKTGQTFAIAILAGPSDVRVAGTNSSGQIVTDSSGVARITVTAPSRSTVGGGTAITLQVTPVNNNVVVGPDHIVTIALSGSANGTAPTPSFTFTPSSPTLGVLVTFDASATTDEGAACGTACTYRWIFGDGGAESGVVVTHGFSFAPTSGFNVTLTVTDAAGVSASLTKVVTVTAAATTVSFVVSPSTTQPRGTTLFFNASTSTTAPGVSIVNYKWVWGDNTGDTNTTTPTTTHVFPVTVPAGTYPVTLTVTDSLGRSVTASVTVTVT